MEHSPPNCNYETFTIHTNSLGASSNTSFLSTFTRPIKDVVEASVISASIRRPDVVHFIVTNTEVTASTELTITHGQLSSPLEAGNIITITGHTGTPQDEILNQEYIVASITSPTVTVLEPQTTTPLTFFPALTLAITDSVVLASSTTECTVTYVNTAPGRSPLDGEQVTVTGHTGTPQDRAMNQVYTVKTGTTPTATGAVLIGTGMTSAIDIGITSMDTSLNININSITTDPLLVIDLTSVTTDPPLVIDLTSVTTTSATEGSVIYTATTRDVQAGEIFNVVGWTDTNLDGLYTVTGTPTAITFDFTSTGMTSPGTFTLGAPQGTASLATEGDVIYTATTRDVQAGEIFTVVGWADPTLNGPYTVTGTPTATTFDFTGTGMTPSLTGYTTGTPQGTASGVTGGTATIDPLLTGAIRVGEVFTVTATTYSGAVDLGGTYTVTSGGVSGFSFTSSILPPAVGTYTVTGTGVATTTSAGRVTGYTTTGGRGGGAVEVGEELIVDIDAPFNALSGTYTVAADPPPTASTFSYTTPILSAVVDDPVTGTGTNNGTYNTPTTVYGTTPSVYNTGTVNAVSNVIVASTSNVVYIRAEELETDFIDFAAAGQPAVATAAAPFNFTTGSNILRRCFGAIYFVDTVGSNRFSYKDRYHMVSQYINPLRGLDKLRITLYDANGAVLDTTQSDGTTYLTFQFKCLRQNLCNFNRCN
jgi:hypothetical protein